jgi:hypothetical protein
MLLDLTFFCHCLGIFGIEGKWHRLVDELMNAMKLLYCEEFMDCQVIPIRSKVLWWDIRKGLARDSGVHFQPKVGVSHLRGAQPQAHHPKSNRASLNTFSFDTILYILVNKKHLLYLSKWLNPQPQTLYPQLQSPKTHGSTPVSASSRRTPSTLTPPKHPVPPSSLPPLPIISSSNQKQACPAQQQ